jgi:hypothetical protein
MLLPEGDIPIRGKPRPYSELLSASGYTRRPEDFEDLCRVLDEETRLISLTSPEKPTDEDERELPESHEPHYRLTHDYLVPSIREWLTRKQEETEEGLTELTLAHAVASFNSKPGYRIDQTYILQPNELVNTLVYLSPSSLSKTEIRLLFLSFQSLEARRQVYQECIKYLSPTVFALVALIVLFVVILNIGKTEPSAIFDLMILTFSVNMFLFVWQRCAFPWQSLCANLCIDCIVM